MYGFSDEQIEILKNKISEVFGKKTDLKVFLFGSRARGTEKRFSDVDLAFKSKDKELDRKIHILKNHLEDLKLPYKFDLLNWDEIFKDYLPTIKKEKKLFWTKDDVLEYSPWRICPIGYHWVREHLKEGNCDSTNPHCRKNPSGKGLLNADEINKISELDIFNNAFIKATTKDLGFKQGNDFDRLINGWCAYWNNVFKIDPPLHPNHVKALIATESGFRINPKRDAAHTAIGITQIMPKTVGLLSSRSRELKDHFLELTKEEVFDPNVNIAASIRWLFRKRELVLRKRKNADWLDTLEEYKGITVKGNKKSTDIKSDIRKFYEKLIHP